MSEPRFPSSITGLAQTLNILLKEQGMDEYVQILEGAVPSVVHLGFSTYGGEYEEWQLRFEIQVERFARIESRLKRIQEDIGKKVRAISQSFIGHQISHVIITPRIFAPLTEATPPRSEEVERLWGVGTFRLFISHLTKDKVFLTELKEALSERGVSAFLAHRDIKPTKEWQQEIELALRSMEAMVVYLTDGFIKSKWTDQEVGWAMGRGVLVIPIKVDGNPYGFMGKYQALTKRSENAAGLANEIVELLIDNHQTHEGIRGALVTLMVDSPDFGTSRMVMRFLKTIQDFTKEERAALMLAPDRNTQVFNAFGVRDWIRSTFGKHTVNADDDALPF